MLRYGDDSALYDAEKQYELFRVSVEHDEVKKPACAGGWNGNVLFSRRATPQVSSGLKGLTAVFGMGTGVSLSL
jgi:hypothetical protein